VSRLGGIRSVICLIGLFKKDRIPCNVSILDTGFIERSRQSNKEVTLAFEFFKESYTGSIREITLGKGDKALTVGGEACYPFYQFEGAMPNKPKIAMEIWDMEPDEWPEAALSPFKDVVSDPAAWAKKCVAEYGADMIVLQLKSSGAPPTSKKMRKSSKKLPKTAREKT
jgi:CO dehydrogenase/acetyl-CoA synthase delta subunit